MLDKYQGRSIWLAEVLVLVNSGLFKRRYETKGTSDTEIQDNMWLIWQELKDTSNMMELWVSRPPWSCIVFNYMSLVENRPQHQRCSISGAPLVENPLDAGVFSGLHAFFAQAHTLCTHSHLSSRER